VRQATTFGPGVRERDRGGEQRACHPSSRSCQPCVHVLPALPDHPSRGRVPGASDLFEALCTVSNCFRRARLATFEQ
jgi:hypothetical protein